MKIWRAFIVADLEHPHLPALGQCLLSDKGSLLTGEVLEDMTPARAQLQKNRLSRINDARSNVRVVVQSIST